MLYDNINYLYYSHFATNDACVPVDIASLASVPNAIVKIETKTLRDHLCLSKSAGLHPDLGL